MTTKLNWQINSASADDTIRLGEMLGRRLKGGEVLELRADLGGGKTTFVRGLAAGLGCKSVVSSPTFTISKTYHCRDGLQLHHFDFYRLTDPGVVADQLAESQDDNQVITAIEWSDIVSGVLPDEMFTLEFKPSQLDPDQRDILVTYPESMTSTMKALETEWEELEP